MRVDVVITNVIDSRLFEGEIVVRGDNGFALCIKRFQSPKVVRVAQWVQRSLNKLNAEQNKATEAA
jgi:hypothetical protein